MKNTIFGIKKREIRRYARSADFKEVIVLSILFTILFIMIGFALQQDVVRGII